MFSFFSLGSVKYILYVIVVIVISFLLFNIYLLLFKKITFNKYLKYRRLPKLLNLYNEIYKKRLDKKVKYYYKLSKYNNSYVMYKNKIVIYDMFDKYYNDIKQYFNTNFLQIKRYRDKYIKLIVKNNFYDYTLTYKHFKKGKVFFGVNENNKKIYKEIKELKHFLIVGQSGSGKSVFTNNVINNLIYNVDMLGGLFLVDLKGGVEYFKYLQLKNNKIKVITNITQLKTFLFKLKELMERRLERMKQKGETFSSELPIFVLFDEIQTINDNKDILGKKEYDKIIGVLQELFSKSRSTNIKLFVITQKPDNINTNIRNNIQNKVILKLNNNSSILTVFGGEYKEQIKEIGISPKYFSVGMGVLEYDDGKGVEYTLLKTPYVLDNFYKNFLTKDKK